jgi:hypothetical protein
MINTFTKETGVEVTDLYWVGNIGLHAKNLTTQMVDYLKHTFSQESCTIKPQSPAAQRNYDAIDVDTMKKLWGQTAWFNTYYQGIEHNELSDHVEDLAKMPGLNEILAAESMNLNDVKVTLNAGDWNDSLSSIDSLRDRIEQTHGSLLVCLQAPHGCMLKAGDTEMKVRRGDVIVLNDRIKHSVMPTKPIYMPKIGNEQTAEWIDKHGIVFMQFNRIKRAA